MVQTVIPLYRHQNKCLISNLNKRSKPVGIMIMPGGCRKAGKNDRLERQSCNSCPRQGGECEDEPQARELASMMAQQWVSCRDERPPLLEAILFLEYPSDLPSGNIRHGYYDGDSATYVEWASGFALPESAVVAWMLVPDVPKDIYRTSRRRDAVKRNARSRRKPTAQATQFGALEG